MSVFSFKHNNLSKAVSALLTGTKVVTKILKLQKIRKGADARKLVLSTNWLGLFNFHDGAPVSEDVIGQLKGMTVTRLDSPMENAKRVYSRGYANRERETMMDIRSQKKINEAFGQATHVHITFTHNQLNMVPVFEHIENMENVGLDINIHNDKGLYVGVLDAVEIIKARAFMKVTIGSDEGFEASHERVLLSMQLRRLGYQIQCREDGSMEATLADGIPATTEHIDTSEIVHHPITPELNLEEPLATFAMCTGGVDIHAMESDGFTVRSILEFRPNEARDIKKDKNGNVISIKDKTELGAISAAINSKAPKSIFNEDIYQFRLNRVSQYFHRHNFLHISLQCCDFSNLKNQADRETAIASLSSTRDMIFPAMDNIKDSCAPTLLVENVTNFGSSIECALFEYKLKQLGYTVFKVNMMASDYNGHTSRSRSFVFGTLLGDDFVYSLPGSARSANVWRDVIEPNVHSLRDITDTKTLQKALKTNRARVINVGDEIAPTITRSQSRQVKDSVYVRISDRYYMPSNDMLRQMMGISPAFNLEPFSNEIGTEIIGQSIDVPMHKSICNDIKGHIMRYIATLRNKVATPFSYASPAIWEFV